MEKAFDRRLLENKENILNKEQLYYSPKYEKITHTLSTTEELSTYGELSSVQNDVPSQSLPSMELVTDTGILMSDVKEINKLFLKESLIVWFDDDLHLKQKTQDINRLKDICELKVFTDMQEALGFIASSAIHCGVITSESIGETFVQKIEKEPCVSVIYMIESTSKVQNEWKKKYSKIIPIKNDFKTLIKKIKSALRVDFPIFSPIFNDDDKTFNNYLHLYLAGLTQFHNRSQAKADFLDLAKAVYQDRRNMDKFNQSYQSYDLKKIFEWYTDETFVYKLTNNCLRIAKPETIQYCRLVINDLETAIKQQYQRKSKDFSGVLYRGTYIADEDWVKLEQNRGRDIEMYGFLSTSKDKGIAEGYIQDDMNKKALVTVIVPPSVDQEDQGFAEIKEFSMYDTEEEVLFNIRSRFTVLDAFYEEETDVKYRHLVLLFGAQRMRRFLRLNNPVIEIILNDMKQTKCTSCQAQLLNSKNPLFMVNLENVNEHFCFDCADKTKSLNIPALGCFSTRLVQEPMKKYKIEGMITRYKEKLNLPFYGYKCKKCQDTKFSPGFACNVCCASKIQWCQNCFDQDNECLNLSHPVVLENYPYSFWSEKMSENEFIHFEFKYNLSDQGDVLYEASDYKKAANYYEKRLEQVETNNKKLKADLYNNLGTVYERLEEFEKAMECHSNALEMFREIYGHENFRTAASYSNLGGIHRQVGQFDKAQEYLSNSLEIFKKIYGNEDPRTGTSYDKLGEVHSHLNKFDEALKCHSNALKIFISQNKYPESAVSYGNLGSVYLSLGKFDKALESHENALEIEKMIYGTKHPVTGISYNNIGSIYHQLKQFYKALEYYLKAMEISKASYGSQHSSVRDSYNNIGAVYNGLGQFEKALEYLEKALKINQAIYGDNHFATAGSYNNIGFAYNGLNKFEQAKECHEKALKIRKAVYGDNHADTATSYNNLGAVYDSLGQLDKALESHSKALEIYESIYGAQHPATATSHSNLGSIYESLEKFDRALECHEKALKIRKLVFGDNDFDTANSYNHLGFVYNNLGRVEEALECHENALKVFESFYPNERNAIATCYYNLASAYLNLGQEDTANECISKGLRVDPDQSALSLEL